MSVWGTLAVAVLAMGAAIMLVETLFKWIARASKDFFGV
jgi:hypothetical protein